MSKLFCFFFITFFATASLFAQENCSNGIDDDGDGHIDYLDMDCYCNSIDGFDLIPNGSLELKSDCCHVLSGDDNCLEDWLILQGTPDLYDPNCFSDTEILDFEMLFGIPLTSNVINFGVAGDFSETFGTCLNAPMLAGELYIFSSDYAQIDIFDPQLDVDTEISIYGLSSCNQLENYNYGQNPCNASPAIIELASFFTIGVPVSSWQELNIAIVPPVDIEAIFIMVTCGNLLTQNQGTFITMDNLSIRSNETFEYEDTIAVNGNVCDFVFFLEVQDSTDFSYQWYYEGNPLLGQTGHTLQLNGQNPLVEGLYSIAIIDPSGCSYVDDFQLVVPTITEEEFYTICPGDSIFVGFKYWDEPGSYSINYLDTISPCQILLNFYIDLDEVYDFPQTASICEGQSIDFRGQLLSESGLYYDSLTTINGCDSVYLFALEVFTSDTILESANICTGQSYNFEGDELTTSGEYISMQTSQQGCDSTIILTLEVSDVIIGDTLYVEIDEGETILFNGENLANQGIYIDTLTSTAGCDSLVYINLTVITPCSIESSFEVGDLTCELANNGYINIEIEEATEAFMYSIDGGTTFSDSGNFSGLSAGNYNIVVTDGLSCVYSLGTQEIIILGDFSALISKDTIIEVGQQITLEIIESSFDIIEYQWSTSTGEINCDLCNMLDVLPTETTTYFVDLIDENGCTLTLQVTVEVRVKSDIFIPNIITPNDDGINETFIVYESNQQNSDVEIFAVYDRWGEKIYEETNFSLNDMKGWNGRKNDRLVAQGVYAFYMILTNENGERKVLSGDITVLR